MNQADLFHWHIDACAQCRTQPFNLCIVGADLLRRATAGDQQQIDRFRALLERERRDVEPT